jgi:hypothetical protein
VFDPLRSFHNEEADRYHELGSAALFGTGHVVSHPTIEAVQAVCLMSSYAGFAGLDHDAYMTQWSLMG